MVYNPILRTADFLILSRANSASAFRQQCETMELIVKAKNMLAESRAAIALADAIIARDTGHLRNGK